MYVAEIAISESGFGETGFVHRVSFDALATAEQEFARVADLIKREAERANDKPAMVDIEGVSGKVSIPLRNIRSIGLTDFAKANDQMRGLAEAFPLLISHR